MRILLVSHAKSDPDAGASRVYHLLDAGLRGRGHHVTTLHYDDLALPRATERIISRLFLPQAVSRRAARQPLHDFDVIMTSSGMLYPLYKKLHRRPTRPLLVNHLHGSAFMDHRVRLDEAARGHIKLSAIYRNLTGPLPVYADLQGSKFADLTISQNGLDQDYFTDQGCNNVLRIPLPLHPELLRGASATTPPEGRPAAALLWFGSWLEKKGCYYLPRAFEIIAAQRPDATLSMWGTGVDKQTILQHFPPSLHSRIHIVPYISRPDQIAAFPAHSIFLFPSLSEGFGFALLEALSMGLAAVTTATGLGADLLHDGVNALIIPPASALHLAQTTLRLMEDTPLRCKLGHAAREMATQHTVDRMIDAYELAFESHLDRRRQTTP